MPTAVYIAIQNQWIPTDFAQLAILGVHNSRTEEMDSLQLEANQLILGRSTISICRMIQYSYCIIGILTIETVHLPESVPRIYYCAVPVLFQYNYPMVDSLLSVAFWGVSHCRCITNKIHSLAWQLEHAMRTCNAVISSCEKAAKWCLRRHQLTATFVYTPLAFVNENMALKNKRPMCVECINWNPSTGVWSLGGLEYDKKWA